MGISGLLLLLKSIQKPCNIKKFAGSTIGVDAYGWLHRGTVACTMDLAFGKPTTKFVEYSMNRVRMLLHFGVTPYIVFDGDYLPSKASTEMERASRREESKKLGLELHRLGKLSQAHLELQKAVDVTPEMAGQFIEELKKLGVQYLVAPYEADAQLAYLERKNIIQGILSEDSDLLVFGAKCLLTKLDQYGDCVEINRKDFTACRDISLVGWSDVEFRLMAILSGCDYLTNINKMGLKTAYRLVRKHKTIEKILQMLAFNNQFQVPPGYLESFRKADSTFLHQRVFCPIANDIVMTTNLGVEPEPEHFTFIGAPIDKDIAIGVARGELHPITKKPMILESNTIKNTPKTPWGGLGKQSSTSFSNMKGNKSIAQFFKTKRTPLAELDPNSFTPSPSQQRLLQQNSWSRHSRPAPLRALLPQPNASTPPITGAEPTRIPQSDSMSSESLSLSHSSKRRRLCSENDIEDDSTKATPNLPSGQSRFFLNSLPKHNTSAKNKCTKRGNDTEINIWSDDSVEDAMAGLPDVLDCIGSVRKGNMQIFRDKDQSIEKSNVPAVIRRDSSSLADSQTTNVSSVSASSVSTTATSVTSTARSLAKTLSENSRVELAALGTRFSYQPTDPKINSSGSVNVGSTPRESHVSILSVSKPHLVRQVSMTPLQRLGAGALSRSQSCSGLSNSTPNLTVKSQTPPPSSKPHPTPKPAPFAETATAKMRGSEDLIVPDSEEDSDAAISECEKPKLDLGRFAFAV